MALPLIAAGVGLAGSLITGYQNKKKNEALLATQRQAQKDQLAAQEQYQTRLRCLSTRYAESTWG